MPGLVINDVEVFVPSVPILNWKDDPSLKRSHEDGRSRDGWVRSIILHTTKGIPGGSNKTAQTIRPGAEENHDRDRSVAKYWSTSSQQSGAHIVVDTDGSAICIADLAKETMYHATVVNNVSIGIEMYQLSDGSIYEATLKSTVAIVETLCRSFGIQRQFHYPYKGGPVPRLAAGGKDCVGVFGHRDVTTNRGAGDPGDFVFDLLRESGFEPFDFAIDADLQTWRMRQRDLVFKGYDGLSIDGIPGPRTTSSAREEGFADGMWTTPAVVKSLEDRVMDLECRVRRLEDRE